MQRYSKNLNVYVSGSVLIVEDDRDVREMVAEYLGGHGYEVCQAQSGGDMREVLERCLPDVVLLDVKLPGEDGLSLARYLRERYDVGIIMVSAAREVIDRVVGLEIGADDYGTGMGLATVHEHGGHLVVETATRARHMYARAVAAFTNGRAGRRYGRRFSPNWRFAREAVRPCSRR